MTRMLRSLAVLATALPGVAVADPVAGSTPSPPTPRATSTSRAASPAGATQSAPTVVATTEPTPAPTAGAAAPPAPGVPPPAAPAPGGTAEPGVTAATPAAPRLRMSAEVDPADYAVYSGWGIYIGVRPAATGRWRFRLGGGAATLPKAASETNDNNKGWRQRLDPVVTVAAQRDFGSGRSRFFVGGVAGWSSLRFTGPSGGSIDVSNVVAGIDVGYRWFPSSKIGLVITPHLGVLVPLWKSDEPTVDGQTYDLLPVIPVPQLLVGYELDLLK